MKKTLLYFALTFLLLTLVDALQAQILSLQGVLRNSDGTALADGTYDLTFKLWDADAGGNLIYTEQQKAPTHAVQVTGGIYSTYLGKVGPITAPFDKPYWLGVTLGSGIEMVPRAQLGSSPYTLSIQGTQNVFPSSGTVGIGFAAPSAPNSSFKLDVNGSVNVAGNQTVSGSSTVGNSVVNGNQTVSGTITSTHCNSTTVFTSSLTANGSINLASQGLEIAPQSRATFNVPVFITASDPLDLDDTWYFDFNGGSHWGPDPSTQDISLTTSNYIDAFGVVAKSDRRIKKDISTASGNDDLALLQKLRVTDYRHIDKVQKGTNITKGFIAQEVKEIYPEAVIQSTDFIPDVYAVATGIVCTEGKMTLSLDKKHGFVAGNEVKIMLPSGEKVFTVAATPTEQSFSVEWIETAPDKAFVYGKKVNDLHAVNYDRIFTLNVSATQELARRQALIENENTALKDEIAGLKAEITALNARQDASAQVLEAFAIRLKALEPNDAINGSK